MQGQGHENGQSHGQGRGQELGHGERQGVPRLLPHHLQPVPGGAPHRPWNAAGVTVSAATADLLQSFAPRPRSTHTNPSQDSLPMEVEGAELGVSQGQVRAPNSHGISTNSARQGAGTFREASPPRISSTPSPGGSREDRMGNETGEALRKSRRVSEGGQEVQDKFSSVRELQRETESHDRAPEKHTTRPLTDAVLKVQLTGYVDISSAIHFPFAIFISLSL
eukprot:Cvel_31317.t1-p1 / transcript=Cvel_31317.t1 / gene=Cvel_31317 / organism=Chromera_velia_CCMP2878 / gene_product=hypothetical protein / transcript_product=hypothetical protein / location=Cvel_scaffold4647:1-3974(-) / protein_length=221 / sequence_SO=supercontig / SO=protein_coding / is_pseudo=false